MDPSLNIPINRPNLQPDPTAPGCAGAEYRLVPPNQGCEHLDQLQKELISTGVGLAAAKPRAGMVSGPWDH